MFLSRDGNRRKRAFLCDCEPSSPVCNEVLIITVSSSIHQIAQFSIVSRSSHIWYMGSARAATSASTDAKRRSVHGPGLQRGSFFTHSNLGAGWQSWLSHRTAQTIPFYVCSFPLSHLPRPAASVLYLEYYICLSEAARSPGASGSWEIISKRAPKRVLLAAARTLWKNYLSHTHLISS